VSPFRATLAAVLVAGASAAVAPSPSEQDEALRRTMRRVLEQLEVVLPASVRAQPLSAVEREKYARGIDALLREADAVDRHAVDRDRGFRYLSRSLATDLAEVSRRLKRGEEEAARYYLVETTSNCVACHARLPGVETTLAGEALYDRVAVDTRSVHERAQLLVATRQFHRAVAEWQALFRDHSFSTERLERGGYLLDYLTIEVRVLRDRVGPQRVLHELAEREDTPAPLRDRLEAWRRALEAIAAAPEPSADERLARARSLIRDAGADGARLVEDLEASALLLRYIDGRDEDDPTLGEAFYLLGLVESRGVDGYWLPMTEAHLEAAVRVDPRGPFADAAYQLLERYVLLGYDAPDVFSLPAEPEERLLALRALLEEAASDLD
jgi:mono/diheme cytochrome c family protein